MIDKELLDRVYLIKHLLSEKQRIDFEALYSKYKRGVATAREICELWVYQELIFYASLKNHKT